MYFTVWVFVVVLFFVDKILLCSPGWRQAHNSPASTSWIADVCHQTQLSLHFFSILFVFILWGGVLAGCMSAHHLHAWCLWRPEEGT